MISFNKILAIQNYGSSGSLFLQSLLDEHPQILSLPALYTREVFRFWEENAPFSSKNDLIDRFVNSPYHAYWFDSNSNKYHVLLDHGLTTLGAEGNENLAINKAAYCELLQKELHHYSHIGVKELLIAIYVAYAKIKNRMITEDVWILFPIHANPRRYAEQLVESFTTVRFVHMIRNPVSCIYSMLKHFQETNNTQRNPFTASVKHMLLDIPHHAETRRSRAYGLGPYFPDCNQVQSCGLRLEDLHTNPKEALSALCIWLGIKWDDCLLNSTFDGKLWNNRKGSIKQNGFSNAVIKQKFEKYSSSFDTFRLRYLARLHYDRLGYGNLSTKKERGCFYLLPLLLLIPFKAERGWIIKYIMTRSTLYKAYINNFIEPFEFIRMLKI